MPKKAEKKAPATDEMAFEEALERLEDIVDQLESGETTLDDSLALFEEGMTLRKLCVTKLDQAETAIKKLIAASDGSLEEEDFELSADEE